MLLLPAACTLDPIRETPRDALTDFPGKVHPNNHDSVRILQQRTVTDGVVLFYRWQTDAAAAAETFCAASAFVTYGASGWQAQSGGYFVGDTVSQPACDLDNPISLKASYYYAGQTTRFTIVYGLSDMGEHVRITWSDATTHVVPLAQGAFLLTRKGISEPLRIEVLDATGTPVVRETWE